VEDEGCGLLLDSGDADSWAAGLMRAAGAPAKRRRWGARAREIALKRLSWDQVAVGFEEQILSLQNVSPAETES
jgi:glycosyltransferase involved in cell wall biosynthesis